MVEVAAVSAHWQLDMRHVRERRYRAPTPRERERWHARRLLAQGRSANKVAELVERAAHTVGAWLAALAFAQTGGAPPPSTRTPGPG
jgi:transposase